MKYTYGPWHLKETQFGLIVRSGGMDIATVHSTLIGIPDEKNMLMGNAKLIAASPDLLKALRSIVYHMTSPVGLLSDEGKAIIFKCNEAIAKAEGRS